VYYENIWLPSQKVETAKLIAELETASHFLCFSTEFPKVDNFDQLLTVMGDVSTVLDTSTY
jgi:hypothetical protein